MTWPNSCLLVSASDTGCGKTIVTAGLALALGQVGVIKLVQAGVGDREYYQRVLPLDQTPEELNPLYFAAPLAPLWRPSRRAKPLTWPGFGNS